MKHKGFSTRAVHAGEPRIQGALTMPIFQSSTFETRDGESYDDIRYIRLNNTPSHDALHAKLAALENGEAALVTSSGMAAITTTLLAIMEPGAHVLAQTGLYGGTSAWLTNECPKLGFDVTHISCLDSSKWEKALTPQSRVFYCETISNPLLEVADLEEVVSFCKRHGLLPVIDNTFASPVLCNPLDLGFELVLHSATKYLNGHTDIVAGCVIGSQARIDQIRHKLNLFGGTLDPHACFLLQRGIKTLELRVKAQSENASVLANWLAEMPQVRRVYHPSLTTHASHQNAKKFLRGYGAMLAFELADIRAAKLFCDRLELGVYAPSLGGVETLVTLPVCTSHASVDPVQRLEMGIGDGLVRVSVGIEDISDLKDDFLRALSEVAS